MENGFSNFAPFDSERIAPDDVENKGFETSLRGFDQSSVRSFLRLVAVDYRKAMQANQLASLALEEAKHEALAIDEKARHASIELAESKRLREEAAKQLEEAQHLRNQSARYRDEAEEVLQKFREAQSTAPAPEIADPYGFASQQITAIMKAAEESALQLRRESEEIVEAARLDAEKFLADADQAGKDAEASARHRAGKIEATARMHANQEEERANVATAHCKRAVEAMQTLQAQVQSALATALGELRESATLQDITPILEAKGIALESQAKSELAS